MRNGNLLFSAAQCLMIAALFSGGAVFFGLHYLPNARLLLSQWVLDSRANFFLLGAFTSVTGVFLTICFWAMQRGSYIRIEMRNSQFSLDEPLIRDAIGQFWHKEFPNHLPPSEVYFARQKIEIITEDRDYNLKEIEHRLSQMLEEKFGYNEPFYLTLKKI